MLAFLFRRFEAISPDMNVGIRTGHDKASRAKQPFSEMTQIGFICAENSR
jgi:hypothetical protein